MTKVNNGVIWSIYDGTSFIGMKRAVVEEARWLNMVTQVGEDGVSSLRREKKTTGGSQGMPMT